MSTPRSRDRRTTAPVAALASVSLVVAAAMLVPPAAATPGPTARITRGPVDGYSALPSISSDGSTVVFSSSSSQLVPGVSGNHLYAADRATGEFQLVDAATDGTPSDTGNVSDFDVSGNGRYVVFVSDSTVLTPDKEELCTRRVRDGDGFEDKPASCRDVYVRDLVDGTTTLVSRAPDGSGAAGSSVRPRISNDGRVVAFASTATNLVPDLPGDAPVQVYATQVATGETTLVSHDSGGAPADASTYDVALSGDGTTVAFASGSANLADRDPDVPGDNMFVHDLSSDVTETVLPSDPPQYSSFIQLSLSEDGQVLAFMTQRALVDEDTNGSWTVYALDRGTGDVTAPHPDAAYEDRPEVSDDGRFVLFRGSGGSLPQAAAGRSDVYVFDRVSGHTELEAVRSDGTRANRGTDSGFSSISSDGRFVTFSTRASDLAADDDEASEDVFVHDRAVPADSATGSGSASTDAEGDGATLQDPMETSVSGSPGPVAITELGAADLGSAPAGYSILGQQVRITADPAVPPAYLTFTFDLDRSVVPSESDPAGVVVLRNGAALPTCGSPSAAGPCTLSATVLGNGDWRFVAHSPQASVWAVAVPPKLPPDLAPPAITVTAPVDGAVLTQGQAVSAQYSCTDPGSGVASCTGPVASGAAISTSTPGDNTFTVQARDAAGNTSSTTVHYQVRYRFSGFFAPIDNPPVLNVAKAGDTIPVPFSLATNQGDDVLAGPAVSTVVPCAPKPATDNVETTLGPSTPPLVHLGGGYVYAWKTSKTWGDGKACRELVLTLKDGTAHRALFRLR